MVTPTPTSHVWEQTATRAPSQYPKRRLSVRSHKVSKSRDFYLKLSDRSEIWQCCRCACQISKRYNNLKYQSRGFETLWDLTKRRLFGYRDGAQTLPSGFVYTVEYVWVHPGDAFWSVLNSREVEKTILWPCNFHNFHSYAGQRVSKYWNRCPWITRFFRVMWIAGSRPGSILLTAISYFKPWICNYNRRKPVRSIHSSLP